MRQINYNCTLIFSILALILSSIIFITNYFYYHFIGNNYFPENVFLLTISLILFNWGLKLYFTKNSTAYFISRELIYFFCVMCIIALATNAVQLTPFAPIDQQIIALEEHLHINMKSILIWTNNHLYLKHLLYIIYDSLAYQMSIIPLLVILTCRFHLLREYYFLLLSTALLGFGFYYFFPTTAPASIINSPLFSPDQIATGLKFQQIHHYIMPTTNAGGLIALPSFHAIWAILCVNLIKEWKIPCIILAIINGLLIVSCVLLGWHYCIDIVGSIIVLLISYYFLKRCQRSK